MATCKACGKSLTLFNKATDDLCNSCVAAGTTAKASANPRLPEVERVMLTTEMQPDIGIRERITIVTAEVAFGMNVFKDIFAAVRNIVGGRSEAVQKTMRDARETVLYELKREAHAVGANAVVGVDLDYTQIGDQGWNMVMLVASGTAVVVAEQGSV